MSWAEVLEINLRRKWSDEDIHNHMDVIIVLQYVYRYTAVQPLEYWSYIFFTIMIKYCVYFKMLEYMYWRLLFSIKSLTLKKMALTGLTPPHIWCACPKPGICRSMVVIYLGIYFYLFTICEKEKVDLRVLGIVLDFVFRGL